VTDWHSTDPAYYFGGDRWDAMARPSVHEGRAGRQKVERQVGALFDRLLGTGRAVPAAGHDDDLRTATHEAGHAYVAWRLGVEIADVRIHERGHGGDTRLLGTFADDDARALGLLAGALAERAILGDVGEGCDEDADRLAEALPHARPDVVARAQALVAEGRTAIQFLAYALTRRRQVSGDEAAEILAEHDDARPKRRASGPVGPQTIVVHGIRRDPRTGEVAPYRDTQTVQWPAEKAAAWNAMYAAADRGDRAAFFRHQDRLAEFR
jgi:hypothetical protein